MAGIVAMAVGVPMAIGDTPSTSASVNNKDPTISCTDPVAVTLNQDGSTVTVHITGTVGDDNGCDEISSVVSNASSAFGTHGVGTSCTKPTTGTSGSFDCTFTLDQCTPGTTYPVKVTVTDAVGATAECTSTVTVNDATGLYLDFSTIPYGALTIDTKKSVTPGYIKNKGNKAMQVSIGAGVMTNSTTSETIAAAQQMAKIDTQEQAIGTATTFTHSFTCTDQANVQFSITAPAGTRTGSYTGTNTISVA